MYEDHDSDYFTDNLARCPHHPTEVISNGTFDAPCGACEGEELYSSSARSSDRRSANPFRAVCSLREYGAPYGTPRWDTSCNKEYDPIPF